eukprot:3804465-Alexandrium_andersonii.AAC.1
MTAPALQPVSPGRSSRATAPPARRPASRMVSTGRSLAMTGLRAFSRWMKRPTKRPRLPLLQLSVCRSRA